MNTAFDLVKRDVARHNCAKECAKLIEKHHDDFECDYWETGSLEATLSAIIWVLTGKNGIVEFYE